MEIGGPIPDRFSVCTVRLYPPKLYENHRRVPKKNIPKSRLEAFTRDTRCFAVIRH